MRERDTLRIEHSPRRLQIEEARGGFIIRPQGDPYGSPTVGEGSAASVVVGLLELWDFVSLYFAPADGNDT